MNRKNSARVDLKKLDATKDRDIDYSEIPELGDDFFANAKRIVPLKPRKTAISARIDTDVLEWLKSFGPGYQGRINNILRTVMTQKRQTVARVIDRQLARAVGGRAARGPTKAAIAKRSAARTATKQKRASSG